MPAFFHRDEAKKIFFEKKMKMTDSKKSFFSSADSQYFFMKASSQSFISAIWMVSFKS